MIQQMIYRGTAKGYRTVALSPRLKASALIHRMEQLCRMPAGGWVNQDDPAPIYFRCAVGDGIAVGRTVKDPADNRSRSLTHLYYIPPEDAAFLDDGMIPVSCFCDAYQQTQEQDLLPELDAAALMQPPDPAYAAMVSGMEPRQLATFAAAVRRCCIDAAQRGFNGVCVRLKQLNAAGAAAVYGMLEAAIMALPGDAAWRVGYRTLWNMPDNNVLFPIFFTTEKLMPNVDALSATRYVLFDAEGGLVLPRGVTLTPDADDLRLAEALRSGDQSAVAMLRAELLQREKARREKEERERQEALRREKEERERQEAIRREKEERERREVLRREKEERERQEAIRREKEERERQEALRREKEERERQETLRREKEERERQEALRREKEERERQEALRREKEERERQEALRREKEEQARKEALRREQEARQAQAREALFSPETPQARRTPPRQAAEEGRAAPKGQGRHAPRAVTTPGEELWGIVLYCIRKGRGYTEMKQRFNDYLTRQLPGSTLRIEAVQALLDFIEDAVVELEPADFDLEEQLMRAGSMAVWQCSRDIFQPRIINTVDLYPKSAQVRQAEACMRSTAVLAGCCGIDVAGLLGKQDGDRVKAVLSQRRGGVDSISYKVLVYGRLLNSVFFLRGNDRRDYRRCEATARQLLESCGREALRTVLLLLLQRGQELLNGAESVRDRDYLCGVTACFYAHAFGGGDPKVRDKLEELRNSSGLLKRNLRKDINRMEENLSGA